MWFTFYLEVAHILYRDQDTLDFEGTNGNGSTGSQSESARRADEFAENALIPDADWQEFTNRVGNGHRGRDWIDSMGEFASSQGIHPSIVAGRLMKDGLVSDVRWVAGLQSGEAAVQSELTAAVMRVTVIYPPLLRCSRRSML